MLVMHLVAAIAAVLVLAGVLWDAFETVVLPRRVSDGSGWRGRIRASLARLVGSCSAYAVHRTS